MNRKPLFTGLGWLLLLNALVKPAWLFLVERGVQNAVGNEAYGRYFALFNLSYVLLFLADAGLTNLLTQRVAAGKPANVPQLVRTKISLLLLYAAACWAVGALTGVETQPVLFYLVGIQALGSLFAFLRGLLAAHQLFATDALFSVLDKILVVALCIGPVYGFFGTLTLPLFLQLQLAATVFSVVALIAVCRYKGLLRAVADRAPVPYLLKSAAPFFLIVLLMAAHYRLDGFLLERLHPDGARQAGIYASAYRLVDAANMLGYLCASFLVPFAARHLPETKTIEKSVFPLRHGLLLVAAVTVAFVGVFAGPLQQLLYRSSDAYTGRVTVLCIAVLPAYYLVHIYGSLLTAGGYLRLFNRILLLSVFCNAALNLWLIPLQGATGCCLAALVSQYGCATALFHFASRRLGLRRGSKAFALYLLCGAGCAGLFALAKNSANPLWVILAACLAATAFALSQRARLRGFLAAFNS